MYASAMHGLTKAINKFKKQYAANSPARRSAPALHKLDSVQQSQAEVGYADPNSEASFHSALNSQNSPSPPPASSPSITKGPLLSIFTVRIPIKGAELLAQYDIVTLHPQDAHFPPARPPSDASQGFAMGSVGKTLDATTPSTTSEDSFKDSVAYKEPLPQKTSNAVQSQATPTRQLFSASQVMYRAGMSTPQTGTSRSVSRGLKGPKGAIKASKERKLSTSTSALATPARSKATKQPKSKSSKAVQIDSDCEIIGFSHASETQKKFEGGDSSPSRILTMSKKPKYPTTVANALHSSAPGQALKGKSPSKRTSSKAARRHPSVSATKPDTADVDADSDSEITSAALRDGGDAKRPLSLDSDVEVIHSEPFKKASPFGEYNRGSKDVGRWRVPSGSKVKSELQNSTSIIPTVEKTRCEIDLTMLSSSDSSDCGSDSEIMVADGAELTNIQALPDSNSFNDRVKPAIASVSDNYYDPGNDRRVEDSSKVSHHAHASLRPSDSHTPGQRERETSPSPVSAPATTSEQLRCVTPAYDNAKHDSLPNTGDEYAEQMYDPYDDHDKRNWPMFDYRFMSPPQTTPMLDRAEAYRKATAEPEKRKAHELVNEERWRNDEGYIPYDNPDRKRKFESDDDTSEVKTGLKKRKLNDIVSSAISEAYSEGIAPFHVRRKRNESDMVFARRLSDFKVGGWKKLVVVSKQRKFAERAKCAKRYLSRICSEETDKVKAEVLKREGLLEMLLEN